MFEIKRISDKHTAARICGSFGVLDESAFAYAAFSKGDVLATAAFTQQDGCVTFCGADTGRRLDIGLIDGMIRAAFSAQMRAGAAHGAICSGISKEVTLAFSKLGYPQETPFSLEQFFSKKCS